MYHLELSLKMVIVKAKFTLTVFKILLFEGRSILGHAQRVPGDERVKFSIICFLETWSNDENPIKHYFFQVEVYSLLHGNRKHVREGAVAIFVHKSLSYIKQNDLRINYEAIKSLSIEITNNDSKSRIFDIVYCLPDGSVIN